MAYTDFRSAKKNGETSEVLRLTRRGRLLGNQSVYAILWMMITESPMFRLLSLDTIVWEPVLAHTVSDLSGMD